MKIRILASALAALIGFGLPGGASAQQGNGVHPYVGAQIGYHDIGVDRADFAPLDIDDSGLIYGGFAGVDVDISRRLLLGVEGNFNLGNSAIDSEYGVAGRIGYRTNGGTILYARVGYQWIDFDVEGLTGVPDPPAGTADTDEDLLFGVGADVAISGGARLRAGVDTVAFQSVRPTLGVSLGF